MPATGWVDHLLAGVHADDPAPRSDTARHLGRVVTRAAADVDSPSRRLRPVEQGRRGGPGTFQASRSDTYGCAREVIASLRALGALRADLDPKAAADVLWLLIDPAQYRQLVTERRWSHRAFQHWQADAMTRLLLA